jgi:hypothetical protein
MASLKSEVAVAPGHGVRLAGLRLLLGPGSWWLTALRTERGAVREPMSAGLAAAGAEGGCSPLWFSGRLQPAPPLARAVG